MASISISSEMSDPEPPIEATQRRVTVAKERIVAATTMLESSYAMDATAQSMIATAQRLRTEAHQKRETATLVLHYFRNEVATAGEVLLQQSRSRSSSSSNTTSTSSNRPNNITHKWQQAQTAAAAAATAAAVQAFTGVMNENSSSNNNYDISSTTTKRKRLTNYGSLAQEHGQQAQTTAAAVAVATGSTYRSDQSFSNEIDEEYDNAAAAACANKIEYYNAAAAATMNKDSSSSSNNHRHDIRLTNYSNLAQEYGAVMPPTYSTNPNPNHPHPHGDNQNNTGTPSWGGMSPPSNSRPTSLLRNYPQQDSICISNNSISSRCSIPASSPPVQTSFTYFHDPNGGTNNTTRSSSQKIAELRDQIDVMKLRQLELLRYFGGKHNPQATATAIATATSCQPVPLVISPQRVAAPPPSPTTTTTTRTSMVPNTTAATTDPAAVRTHHHHEKEEQAILVPGPLDVLMGNRCFPDRSGNPYFQALLASHMTRYDSFESNLEKYDFTEAIVAKLRHDGSRFLMRAGPDMLWTEISFEKAREKVARDFRNLRATQKKDNDNDDSDEEYVPQKGDKWTQTEHDALIRGIARYGYNYKQLATLVPCRTAKGVRRYIQRHSLQQQLRAEGENRDNDHADSEVDTNCVVNKEVRHDEKEEKQKAGTNARANINSENMNDKHNAENPNSSSIIVADTITSHKRLPSLASTTTTTSTTKFSVKTETGLGANNARSSSASLLAQPCGDYTATSSEHRRIVPGCNDVLFGKGKKIKEHEGNIRLEKLIQSYEIEYENAGKFAKTDIAERIIRTVHEEYEGCFLKLDPKAGYWEEVERKAAREKVAHYFRHIRKKKNRQIITSDDAPSSLYASSFVDQKKRTPSLTSSSHLFCPPDNSLNNHEQQTHSSFKKSRTTEHHNSSNNSNFKRTVHSRF